ncbi:MAG: PDZ domain-containing protein [Lachnospiraceae bacterium]|uniref:S1C family serine protease n=1 Tax=uncultured Acetatifactor sp. TaxID=1671927 RepID=UPI002612CD27|nr:trypsin-like peptidase domain-containing protein [uncultured Acetatifactor sp.]MCI8789910.1 PDZ domain-containing protein [Lachnospiraceae bacterium]
MYENDIYSNSDNGSYTTYQTDANYNKAMEPPAGIGGKKKKGGFRKVLLSMGLGLLFGLFAGAGFYVVQFGLERISQTEEQGAGLTDDGEDAQTGLPEGLADAWMQNVKNITYVNTDISNVVEDVMPAMVSIVNNYTQTGTTFWGQQYSQQGASSGSGIIVAENESELLIVSNNHVVQGMDTLEVTFIDGSVAQAYIKGTDAEMDLAVIAVPLENLSQETKSAITIATMGDSDDLKLGTPVIAIGNALGYGQSVTSGIISALNREVTMEDGTVGTFIQTDTAINPGNSGGALLNINGEVIGINSNKIASSQVEGMGYAIPISSASPIIADLLERQTRTEKVAAEEAGYMGIEMQDVTDEIAAMLGIPQGVFVINVQEGTAAQQAGIQHGDIIIKFDGQRVSTRSELKQLVGYYRAGETLKVTVKRFADGRYEDVELEVTLGSQPQN